jgi:hypothetical protein
MVGTGCPPYPATGLMTSHMQKFGSSNDRHYRGTNQSAVPYEHRLQSRSTQQLRLVQLASSCVSSQYLRGKPFGRKIPQTTSQLPGSPEWSRPEAFYLMKANKTTSNSATTISNTITFGQGLFCSLLRGSIFRIDSRSL